MEEAYLLPQNLTTIATKLGVTEDEVTSMNRRMSAGGDASLNAPIGGMDGEAEWQDWIADDTPGQAERLAEKDEFGARMSLLERAMESLNERERHIITERRLKEEPTTLEDLSTEYNVSRERIRQIEVRAFEKLQDRMRSLARDKGMAIESAS